MDKSSQFFNRRTSMILIIIGTFVFAVLVTVLIPRMFHNILSSQHSEEISLIYDVATIMGTCLIVYITYMNLYKMADDVSANFILEVDKRFCDPQSKIARTIIHIINLDIQTNSSMTKDKLNKAIGKEIIKMSELKEQAKRIYVADAFFGFHGNHRSVS